MKGNFCPHCGKSVMSYWRFVKEAEPYKTSRCGSCGVELKRSPRVIPYILLMSVLVAAMSIPLFLAMAQTRLTALSSWSMAILCLAAWSLVVNHLSWRYIGWIVAEKGATQPKAAAV